MRPSLYKNIRRKIETNISLTKEDLTRFQTELKTFKDLEEKLAGEHDRKIASCAMSLNAGSSIFTLKPKNTPWWCGIVDGLLQVAAKIP